MRRKTVEELKRAGTYRADRHATREASGSLLKVLPPPPFALSDTARAVYQEEGARLIEMEILKPSDLRLLAMFSEETGVYISEMKAAREEGFVVVLPNGISATNAHRKTAEQAFKLAAALAEKLGLTPASRARLKGEAAFLDEKPGAPDPLDFLNN